MNATLHAGDWLALTLRILLAAFAGGVVGYNRERRGKPAGLRTHVLVSVGAALFVMIPLSLSPSGAAESTSRVIQGVAAGIGFLGAGEILRTPLSEPSPAKVKGLTSAAAIWVAAGLGAVAGCGLWQLTVVGSVTTLVVLAALWRLERFAHERRE
jgi:putative Mg2+ transporter-C (MgtC) family protein